MDTSSKKPLAFITLLLIRVVQISLYIPIQILFIPLAIAGIIHGLYREKENSKKYGVSFSAGQALQYRWVLHYFNLRKDSKSVEFIKHFPCESHFGLLAVYGPLIIMQRFFSFNKPLITLPDMGKESLTATAGARVVLFDAIMKKYLDEVDQIVIPGVGYDLICLHFTEGKEKAIFELDQSKTITMKTDTLTKAQIKHEWIDFIEVNYETESWSKKLVEAGFDKSKKTLFLWQSVSHFLDEEQVRQTLKEMANLCTQDSIIVQDFYSKRFTAGQYSMAASKIRMMMGKMGEPWKFGIDMSEDPKSAVKNFLDECGLEMTEIYQFGEKLNIEPFYCVVEARKQH